MDTDNIRVVACGLLSSRAHAEGYMPTQLVVPLGAAIQLSHDQGVPLPNRVRYSFGIRML